MPVYPCLGQNRPFPVSGTVLRFGLDWTTWAGVDFLALLADTPVAKYQSKISAINDPILIDVGIGICFSVCTPQGKQDSQISTIDNTVISDVSAAFQAIC